MDFRILGPLDVRIDGAALALGGPKQQTVLALLAANEGRAVPIEDVVDELWPEQPPASAVENARSYIRNLHRLFRSSESGVDRIIRRGSSYILNVSSDELDLLAFEEDCRRARQAVSRDDLVGAADLLERASSRWRGPMLVGISQGPILTKRSFAVEQERLVVIEEHAELRLALREPDRTVALLREHVRSHPLRERAYGLLMTGLHQIGDTAAALAVYGEARAVLVDELGIEPGQELQRIHRAVLRRDLEVPGLSDAAGAERRVSTAAPHELPPDIGLFVGRTAETAQLRAALAGDKRDAVRPRVLVLYGQGGVGKSTLAVHFGQAVREGFPDGQLYLDLHGSTPGLRQLSPSDALGRLLRSLGVPRKEVPADEAEAAAHFRTLTADSRLFVLLDNASDATQVLPLLPGGAGCAVVITSRTPLAAIDADCRVRLDVLSPHEGATLLQRVAGHAPADAPAITRIVDFCECLPLAIRIAAGRLSSRPDLTVHELADRLADDRRRLDELELEGLALRSCIRVGYDALAASHTHVDQLAACAFRCLGLLDVPSVQIDVIGAMLDTPDLHLVRLAVDRLVTAQLVEATAGGRYRLHDLVRLVAAEVAVEQDSPETRNEVLERAFCYYLQNLTAAEDAIRPERVAHAVKEFPKMRADGVIFSAPKHAAAWLDTEIANLVAAAEQAGRPPGIHRRFALWITYWAWPSLHTRCEFQTAGRLAMLVMESAYCHDDRAMIGWAHFLRGRYDADSGNYDAALDNLRRALSIIGASNPYGTATVLIGLGIASSQRGRPEEAAKYFADCIDHASRYKLVGVGATATHNLGNACMILGRWDEARAHVVKALAIREAIDHREGIGSSLDTLAAIHCHNGAFAEAVRCAERAAAFHQEDGDQLQECNALLIRAEVRLRQGLYRATLDEAEDLLALSRRRGYPYGEAAALQLSAKAANLLGDQSGAEQRSALAAELFARPSVHEPVISVLLHETDSLLPGDRNPHPVEQADADQES